MSVNADLELRVASLLKSYTKEEVKAAVDATPRISMKAVQDMVNGCLLRINSEELTNKEATMFLAAVLWSPYFPCVDGMWRGCNDAVRDEAKKHNFSPSDNFPTGAR